MAKQAIQDVIVFKEGDLLNARILNSTFPMKTSYGEVVIKKKEVANIHMRGTQFRTDQIITLDLNRFKGSLQETVIRIKLTEGSSIEVPKNKINTVLMLTNFTSA